VLYEAGRVSRGQKPRPVSQCRRPANSQLASRVTTGSRSESRANRRSSDWGAGPFPRLPSSSHDENAVKHRTRQRRGRHCESMQGSSSHPAAGKRAFGHVAISNANIRLFTSDCMGAEGKRQSRPGRSLRAGLRSRDLRTHLAQKT
jgi:hypothetical protein